WLNDIIPLKSNNAGGSVGNKRASTAL
ncbi:MAG: hypothetical protein AVDCRST_MAG93-61, partial [uncultured Chloroflexia bacterium]